MKCTVITSPTHVAVALRYDREKMAAPVVVAKGYDEVEQRIKALATEVEIVHPVPTRWHQGVAEA